MTGRANRVIGCDKAGTNVRGYDLVRCRAWPNKLGSTAASAAVDPIKPPIFAVRPAPS